MLMLWLKTWLSSLDEEGQGLVEYALILVLIAIAVIAILGTMGDQINNIFNEVSNALDP